MFNSLSGTITGKFPRQLFIDTHGIEWDVCVPDKCLEEFPPAGNQGKVYTYMNHYENGMDLYGFATLEERNLFLDLLKVDGIGPKAAVKIMSSVSVKELIQVLESGEVAVLEKLQFQKQKQYAFLKTAHIQLLLIPCATWATNVSLQKKLFQKQLQIFQKLMSLVKKLRQKKKMQYSVRHLWRWLDELFRNHEQQR